MKTYLRSVEKPDTLFFFLGTFLRTFDCLVYSYYKCISVFIFRAIVNELQPMFMCFLCCFYLKKILIENSFSFVEKFNFSFV